MVESSSPRVALAKVLRRSTSASSYMPLLIRASPSASCASTRRSTSTLGRSCTWRHSSRASSSSIAPPKRMWQVPHFCHASACDDALGSSLCSASLTRQATCAHPASPRQAHPDWIGAGSSSESRQMMHAPAAIPRARPTRPVTPLVASFALALAVALHTTL